MLWEHEPQARTHYPQAGVSTADSSCLKLSRVFLYCCRRRRRRRRLRRRRRRRRRSSSSNNNTSNRFTIESPVAQWLEHLTRSRRVVGSDPIWGSDFFSEISKHLIYQIC